MKTREDSRKVRGKSCEVWKGLDKNTIPSFGDLREHFLINGLKIESTRRSCKICKDMALHLAVKNTNTHGNS